MHILIPLLMASVIYFTLRYLFRRDPARFTRNFLVFLLILLLAVLALLALTGQLHWLFALLAGMAPFFRRIMGLLTFLPYIQQARRGFQQGNQQQNNQQQNKQQGSQPNDAMTRNEALAVLGLAEGASREDIMQAYKRMMQRCHPDQGGSDYLAAQLNRAKEVLLG